MKLKTTDNIVRPTRYSLSNVPHEYVVTVKNRLNGLDLVDRVPEELCSEILDIIHHEANKNIPNHKKSKKAMWLSADTLKVAEERRKAKDSGDKEKFTRLNAAFQRMARRDKEKYMNNQCRDIEDNN